MVVAPIVAFAAIPDVAVVAPEADWLILLIGVLVFFLGLVYGLSSRILTGSCNRLKLSGWVALSKLVLRLSGLFLFCYAVGFNFPLLQAATTIFICPGVILNFSNKLW